MYPKREIKKVIEHISKIKSIKVATDSEIQSLKSRLSGHALKYAESEAENYKFSFNCDQLRKQNEAAVKNFDAYQEDKERELKKMQQRVEQVLADKKQWETAQHEQHGQNSTLIRRKEHAIQNLKRDLEDRQQKLDRANRLLKDENQRYESLYLKWKGGV